MRHLSGTRIEVVPARMLTVIIEILLTELHGAVSGAVIHPTRALTVFIEHSPDPAHTSPGHLVIEIALAVFRIDTFMHLPVGVVPHEFRAAGTHTDRDLPVRDHSAVRIIHIPVARLIDLGVLDHLALLKVVNGSLISNPTRVVLARWTNSRRLVMRVFILAGFLLHGRLRRTAICRIFRQSILRSLIRTSIGIW